MTRHALILAILLAGAGCQTKPADNARKLAALEDAYRSGVFTKEEYESKKAALRGTAAAAPAAPVAEPAPAPPPPAASPTPSPTTAPKAPPAPQPSARPAAPAAPAETAAAARACSEPEMQASKGKGMQDRFFAAPPAAVHKAAEAALANLNFTIHKQTDTELEAARGKRVGAIIGTGGERVSLRLEAQRQGGRSGTLVTGLTNQGLAGKITQRSWTSAVLAEIACQLSVQ